jgi:hydrogenase/urease accessory protein HupE
MYALSWLFLAVAVVSLLLGLTRSGLTFIYVSIAASVAAMLLLLVSVVRGSSSAGPPVEEQRGTQR